jgi:hypothetical protein
VLLIGDQDRVCDDRVAARVRSASPPGHRSPVSLRAELRDIGLL